MTPAELDATYRGQLVGSLMNVMTPINRAYPDLKASDGYKEVMTQLQQIEATILSRRDQSCGPTDPSRTSIGPT